jgi:hypothetical protein
MTELIVIEDSCHHCGLTLSAWDNYCRNCGQAAIASASELVDAELIDSPHETALVARHSTIAVAPRERSLVTQILENRFYVISILLCVGPIGLPALWFSRRFSRRAKIITTTCYFLFTVVIPLMAAWYFLNVALRPIVDALS